MVSIFYYRDFNHRDINSIPCHSDIIEDLLYLTYLLGIKFSLKCSDVIFSLLSEEEETARPITLTRQHKGAIRAIRKVNYFIRIHTTLQSFWDKKVSLFANFKVKEMQF